jgi:TPP-dependent pyruvate/acetoin dehydrogenase alpha subunit
VTSATAPHDELDAHVRNGLARLGDNIERGASDPRLLMLFDAMAGSRLLDIEARHMRERGAGFYTIGSAGHESNAIVADALRATDPALLHYRSGAFFLARAMQAGRSLDGALRAVLLGLAAAVDDPASGGRHKVFGDASLDVIPQTSTIASHLPRAVGVAFALGRARKLAVPTRWAPDSVVLCSFGDASLNHSTATGALNTAGYCVTQGLPLPIVFVCEDNGLGISVPTPTGWVKLAAQRPGIRYLAADGDDPEAVSLAAREAADTARPTPLPRTSTAIRCSRSLPSCTAPTCSPAMPTSPSGSARRRSPSPERSGCGPRLTWPPRWRRATTTRSRRSPGTARSRTCGGRRSTASCLNSPATSPWRRASTRRSRMRLPPVPRCSCSVRT